jgi:hypothetical protein
MGDEMIRELASQLGGLNKTAAKKEEDKACKKCECEPCECAKGKKKSKKSKKSKKKEAASEVVSGLYKLANELDEIGADEASALVDDALKVIVKNITTASRLWSEDREPGEMDEEEGDLDEEDKKSLFEAYPSPEPDLEEEEEEEEESDPYVDKLFEQSEG